MWKRDYAAAKIARRWKTIIPLFGISCAALTVCGMCWIGTIPPQRMQDKPKKHGVVIVTGPGGFKWEIEGLGNLIAPIIEQGKTMNKIEAMENHAQFPWMSDNPKDYTDG